MRSRASFLFALSGLLISFSASALTLPGALQVAQEHSPELQIAKSAAEEASWKRVEAFSTYLPQVTAGASYLMDKKYMLVDMAFSPTNIITVPNIVPTTMYSIEARYLLFDGFAGTNRWLAAKSFESAAAKQAEWTRFQTQRKVALQFYKTLAAELLKDVADQNIKSLEDHLKDVGLFKRAGISTNFDVLRVEVQVSEARSEVMNATDNIEISRGQLGQALGLEEPQQATGKLPVLSADLLQKLSDNDSSVSARPDLQALTDRSTGYEKLANASGRHWIPKVGLFGVYQSYNNRTNSSSDWDQFREAYQVGVNLSWDLFDGFSSTAKSHESFEQQVQAEKSLLAARLKAKQDFTFWRKKFAYYCTVYRSRLSDIDKSKESVRLAREGRRVGARTNTELLDAESELYRSQAGAVNAQVGAIEALINLELATGRSLTEWN